MSRPPSNPSRFEEAVAWFRARVPMTDEEYRELEGEAKEKAFAVAGVAQLDVVQAVFSALERAISEGTTLEDFKAEVGERLEREWGGESPSRLDTIFRTNVQLAYGAGRFAQMTDPDVLEALPFWRFNATMDTRTSAICRALDGTLLPASDGFWRRHIPPLHFQCRSAIQALTAEDAHQEGVSARSPVGVHAAKGFGAVPSSEPYSPSEDAYSPALWAAYQRNTG